MENICSLHKIPAEGAETEAYIAQDLAAQSFISHDGINRIFMHTHTLEVDAIDATIWVNADGSELTSDERAWSMAKLMAGEHPPIHDYQRNWSQLFRHPAHRLWCAKYTEDTMTQFQEDLDYMSGMIESGLPEATLAWTAAIVGITPATAPTVLLGLIAAFKDTE